MYIGKGKVIPRITSILVKANTKFFLRIESILAYLEAKYALTILLVTWSLYQYSYTYIGILVPGPSSTVGLLHWSQVCHGLWCMRNVKTDYTRPVNVTLALMVWEKQLVWRTADPLIVFSPSNIPYKRSLYFRNVKNVTVEAQLEPKP